jgi:hypothetical protein
MRTTPNPILLRVLDQVSTEARRRVARVRLLARRLGRCCASITIGKRGRPLSPSSIRRIHATLRSALGTAVKRRLIP